MLLLRVDFMHLQHTFSCLTGIFPSTFNVNWTPPYQSLERFQTPFPPSKEGGGVPLHEVWIEYRTSLIQTLNYNTVTNSVCS